MDYFNTDAYAIDRYEQVIPDMLFEAQKVYADGKLDPKAYLSILRKIYALLEMIQSERP